MKELPYERFGFMCATFTSATEPTRGYAVLERLFKGAIIKDCAVVVHDGKQEEFTIMNKEEAREKYPEFFK